MRSLRPAFISALGLGFSVLFASSLLAQRAFVSAVTGNDANPCTRSSPCRSFATAISTVAAGGEVVVLDSGGYGPFTVSKAVSIETPAGIYAGVSATSGDGIDVSAGASDRVVLKGLTLQGFGGANNGITFSSGAALYVENFIVNGFPLYGIYQTGNGSLLLTDTTVRNGGFDGVFIQLSAPLTGSNLLVDHCRFENNVSAGLFVYDGVKSWVRDSVATSNYFGFEEATHGTAAAELNIENCLVTNNTFGVSTSNNGPGNSGPGTLRLSGSTVTQNTAGLANAPGHTFESFGNNHVRGNTNDTLGVITQVGNN